MAMNAPDCVQGPDGRYYLYYQLALLTCSCVAVADTPIGPFEYYGCVQYLDGTPYGEKKGDTFAFDGSESRITVTVRGEAAGTLKVYTNRSFRPWPPF